MDTLLKQLKDNNSFKRFLVTPKYVAAWTTLPPDVAITIWKQAGLSQKLRLIPNQPIENGITQEYWNQLWDSAIAVQPGIRYM